jgi:hypothetical protein
MTNILSAYLVLKLSNVLPVEFVYLYVHIEIDLSSRLENTCSVIFCSLKFCSTKEHFFCFNLTSHRSHTHGLVILKNRIHFFTLIHVAGTFQKRDCVLDCVCVLFCSLHLASSVFCASHIVILLRA